MKAILKNDFIIPAGTVFDTAPTKREFSSGWTESIIGINKDNTAYFSVFVGEGQEKEDLQELFTFED